MAFFPTQKETWDKLQKSKETKNNCGRPGVNGGYMDNPDLRFGVNCFGKKRSPTDTEINYFNENKLFIPPSNDSDKKLDSKVEYWKKQIADGNINMNAYNLKQWSEY
jgi:hypothetical protein